MMMSAPQGTAISAGMDKSKAPGARVGGEGAGCHPQKGMMWLVAFRLKIL